MKANVIRKYVGNAGQVGVILLSNYLLCGFYSQFTHLFIYLCI